MDSELALKTWFRMLSNTALIEQELRTLFVNEFNVTLPQFDLMAALHHAGGSEKMSALSKWMKVSNGNITGVVDRLERDGLVARQALPEDRRVKIIHLTETGSEVFTQMAKRHKEWISTLLDEISEGDLEQLHLQLMQLSKTIKRKLQ
ncbi:MarR family winged helix-turn-helix transcriptional regulator [Marinobacterium stanieri]|uniref:DNA-binding transcriptional regulator, MarR family n=1 Tax=Marinobacterium stanieri TaxID=49186 RepID=A0A1N6T984_9GAMM|nr:MarR family transcriptional regulator [Marinobacterium stanieri]SIQ49797.1 DNA-binding transcriptional regulator, MarR family [Marinobacterium stanieri]